MTTQQQIADLRTALEQHCSAQGKTDAIVAQQIEQLMPLTDLIPILQQIVEDKKTTVALNKRFASIARTMMAIGGVIAATYAIVQLIFKLR